MDDEVLGRGVHGQLQWVAGDPMDVRLVTPWMVGLLQDEVQEKHYRVEEKHYRVEERHHQVDKHKILQVGEHGLAGRLLVLVLLHMLEVAHRDNILTGGHKVEAQHLEGKLDQGVQEGAAQAVHGVGVGSIQEVEVHSF